MSSMRSVILKSGSSRYSIKFPLSIRISSVPRGIHPLTIKLFDWLNDLLEVFVKTTAEFGGSMIATPESAYAVSTSSDHPRVLCSANRRRCCCLRCAGGGAAPGARNRSRSRPECSSPSAAVPHLARAAGHG
ncbi:hypothetical protein GQ42DRAFT_154416 [Ramicandelaber brevisporus]|nr:hypothetical protein GQ42DRAFT_154416 [Ramicandelaber brevisporus]